MEVTILSWTQWPVFIIAAAARQCYSKDGPTEAYSWAQLDEVRARTLIDRCIQSGHHSVLEHASITFGVEGISRACSHQLVRHRLCAISQQSQRYVDLRGIESYWVRPKQLAEELFTELMQEAWTGYEEIAFGLPDTEETRQDARYILPNACKTNLLWTMNLRELMHICSVRLCKRAQWEIRGVIEATIDAMLRSIDDFKWFTGYLTPKCQALGYCPEENRGCGDMPSREKVLAAYERTKEA